VENTKNNAELYNNHLEEVETATDKAITLLRVIQDNHFSTSAEALEKDAHKALLYKMSYAEIQSLLSILTDYVWTIKEKMGVVMAVDVK